LAPWLAGGDFGPDAGGRGHSSRHSEIGRRRLAHGRDGVEGEHEVRAFHGEERGEQGCRHQASLAPDEEPGFRVFRAHRQQATEAADEQVPLRLDRPVALK
jgi:hypothetical protein